ncbi:MAG: cell division protein ZapA [Smithellaceae bacterium]|nr:cell division protein ZapA [Syntrophaceae bacterium]MDD4240375.1 cell division protein ZapA [Smithellaceae bacterium]NLX52120.1 cell division protein ZapA [Deltaproteobacteria bacterium]
MKKRYDINILGQELAVLSDADDEQVASVVRYVNERMEDILRTNDGLRAVDVAILAALNITEDFLKLKGVNEDLCNQLQRRSERLIRLIENAS